MYLSWTWSLKLIIYYYHMSYNLQPTCFFSIKWCIRFLPYSKYPCPQQSVDILDNLSPSFLTPKKLTKQKSEAILDDGQLSITWEDGSFLASYPKIPENTMTSSMGRGRIFTYIWTVDLCDKLVGKYTIYMDPSWVIPPWLVDQTNCLGW